MVRSCCHRHVHIGAPCGLTNLAASRADAYPFASSREACAVWHAPCFEQASTLPSIPARGVRSMMHRKSAQALAVAARRCRCSPARRLRPPRPAAPAPNLTGNVALTTNYKFRGQDQDVIGNNGLAKTSCVQARHPGRLRLRLRRQRLLRRQLELQRQLAARQQHRDGLLRRLQIQGRPDRLGRRRADLHTTPATPRATPPRSTARAPGPTRGSAPSLPSTPAHVSKDYFN